MHEFVGLVTATQRCAAIIARPDLRELAVGCGLMLHGTARLEGPNRAGATSQSGADSVTLTVSAHPGARDEERRSIALAPGVEHDLDDSLVDPSAPGCLFADAGAPPRVDVRVDRAWEQDTDRGGRVPVLVLSVPRLGIVRRENLDQHEYCHGHRFVAAALLDVTCAVFGSGVTYHVRARDGAIYVSSDWGDEDGTSRDVLGGVALPCGAAITWPRVHWPNPKWAPYGDSAACRYAHDLCEDPCTESFTDENGDFTDKGNDCQLRCSNARSACRDRPGTK